MPRDLSGNYTLPVGNPVVNATVISPAWGNGTMSDIANQLNNVLTRDGLLAPTIPMVFPVGAVGAPSVTFAGSLTSGLFVPSANVVAVSISGVERGRFTTAGLSLTAGLGIGSSTPPNNMPSAVWHTGLTTDAASSSQVAFGTAVEARHILARSRGAAYGSYTAVIGGDSLGRLSFYGSDASNFGEGAYIQAAAYTTFDSPGNVRQTRLGFFTAGATGAPLERLRITQAGATEIYGPSTGETPLTVTKGSLGITGISVAAAAGVQVLPLQCTGATTERAFGQFTNTSGEIIWGVENSAGNSLATGCTAYSTVLGNSTARSLHLYTNSVVRLTISSAGNVTIPAPSSGTGLVVTGTAANERAATFAGSFGSLVTTVAGLPTGQAAIAGSRAFVSDATVTTFASIVAGGGANNVPVYSDGTNWRIG